MTGPRPAELLRHLAAEAASDHDLLRRYAANRDGDAFAELVRRHGPVVLAACRRGVRHHHDADDAFQAVFLVLARRAGAINRPELLGNWLYGVAVRVARHARRAAARRSVREVQGVDVPEPVAPPTTSLPDLGPVLDEELEALPVIYRDAVVLCDLRGASRADAAAALGVPLGTLASRLDAGRKKLAVRLVRRGMTLSVAAAMVEAKALAVPDFLLKRTCEVVATWSAGGALPQSVLNLAQGGLSMRGVVRGGALAVALVAGTALAAVLGAQPAPPSAPEPPAAAAQPEAKAGPQPGKFGPPRLKRTEDLAFDAVGEMAWSPDGAQLVARGHNSGGIVPGMRQVDGGLNVVEFLDTSGQPQPPRQIFLPKSGRLVGFIPDGRQVVTALRENLLSGRHRLEFWEHRPDPEVPRKVETKFLTREEVDFSRGRNMTRVRGVELDPEATDGIALAREGKTFRTVARSGLIGPCEVREVSAESGKVLRVLVRPEGNVADAVLAADGGRVALRTPTGGVVVWNVGKDGREHVIDWLWPAGVPPEAALKASPLRLSPDSRLLLVVNAPEAPQVVDCATGKVLSKLECRVPFRAGPPAECFSHDGGLVVLTGWDVYPGFEGKVEQAVARVWETATGRVVRTWQGRPSALAFNPVRPLLAVLEPHGNETRLGLWDFSAQP